ncbi:uncharacterized protein LOC126728460 [Quercus robur]|uniref:uncharacterized protein LOC126728460 n=1 Tax=Quercus robur TaxID=38942 RepID=UPI002163D6BD|nr:uncharacterized protein LOC126728460 [Quercus robur]
MEKFIADYRIPPNMSLRHYPNAFHQHFHLVNRVNLETVLQVAVFVNDEDGQAAKDEGNLGLFEEGFGAFDQVDPSEDPSGDLGDPDLSEAELLSAGISSRAKMGLKRKPPTSLFDLIEGQPGKGAQEKPQSSVPTPPSQPQPVQTRSSSTKSQPQSPRPKLPAPPQSALPLRPEPDDSKRKRSPKGKEPVDGGKSQSFQEGDEVL